MQATTRTYVFCNSQIDTLWGRNTLINFYYFVYTEYKEMQCLWDIRNPFHNNNGHLHT